MENLIFSLNATAPVFFLMLLGMLFRKTGWIDPVFAEKMNRFVFMVSLPLVVFQDLAEVDLGKVWNGKFVLFCFTATVISIALAVGVSYLCKDRTLRGEFVQASYRSSAALLGIALIQNIYGNAGMAPLMLMACVPVYNIMAVVVLSVFREEEKSTDRIRLKKTIKEILTNPIIIGITVGILWSVLKMPMPKMIEKTVSALAGTATPMGLMAMGASIDLKKTSAKMRLVAAAVFIKLIGLAAVFLPFAAALGFRREELVAILIMLGSATTVSSYVMAKNMGYEGTISSGVVMLTTLFSAFTLTSWIYLLRSLGLI